MSSPTRLWNISSNQLSRILNNIYVLLYFQRVTRDNIYVRYTATYIASQCLCLALLPTSYY
jgi:hypothetical protein